MESNKNVVVQPNWFPEALTLVFVTLKLTGVIDWSWWWVLSPLWIQIVFMAALFVAALAFVFTKEVRYERKRRYARRGR